MGRWQRFDRGDGRGDLRVQLFFQSRVGRVVEQAAVDEVAAEARLRVALHPELDLVLRSVARGIVARGVRADAVGEGLDVRRAAARAGPRDGVRDGVVEREDVVAVDADRRDAVGAALDREGGRGRLPARRHADRPVVVLADDHAGHAVHARERHRGVEVGLARRAVADEAEGDDLVALELGGPRGADGLRELRAEAARPRDLVHLPAAHVRGHLATLQDIA